MRLFILLLISLILALAPSRADTPPFLVKPYVQIGNSPALAARERVEVLWQTTDVGGTWEIQRRVRGESVWRVGEKVESRLVRLRGTPPFRLWRAVVGDLPPGQRFQYRLWRDGEVVFTTYSTARKDFSTPYRFAVFGDVGTGSSAQKAIALQAFRANPDFAVLCGDVAYDYGTLSDYRARFFPYDNSDLAAPSEGAPLLRTTMVLPAPGNHDIGKRDMNLMPDAFAFYYLWSLPLNGPLLSAVPKLSGSRADQRAFLAAAGDHFPRMGNYWVDYGNARWLVLDVNWHTNLLDPALRSWMKASMASAPAGSWKFVALHQPPFHASHTHGGEQRARLLADLFDEMRVDVVFGGHVHNYQRSRPLRFTRSQARQSGGRVAGQIAVDAKYDGVSVTRPNGVIYIVSGAGGAGLYDGDLTFARSMWPPFTAQYIADRHSYTLVDVNGSSLYLRQLDTEGREIDRIRITR